jgi:hypothetical protein
MTVRMRSNFPFGALSGLAGVTPGRPAVFREARILARIGRWLQDLDRGLGAICCQCQLAAMSEGDAPGVPNRGETQVAAAGTSPGSVSASTFQQEESG